MRGKSPLRPSPKSESTEAAFWFSVRWTALMVSYVGRPMIGSMVGFGKAPTMSALAGLMGARWGRVGGKVVNKFNKNQYCLMMKSGMRLRKLDDDYKAMVMQTIDITD